MVGILQLGAVVVALSATPAEAAEGGFVPGELDHWGVEHGLRGRSVQALLFEETGPLWVGTRGGLRRFDGLTFARPAPDPLLDEWILSLARAPGGGVLAGTSGRGLLAVTPGGLRRWSTASGLPGNVVSSLLVDPGGDVWVGTERGACWLANDRCTAIPGLPATAVRGFARDGRGGTWVATQEAGLWLVRGGERRQFLGSTPVNAVAVFEGAIWAAGPDGLARIVDGRVTTVLRMPGTDLAALLPAAAALLAGGPGTGLIRWTAGATDVRSLSPPRAADDVFALASDPEGSLWIGTEYGLFRSRPKAFRTLSGSRAPTSVLVRRGGRLWATDDDEGLLRSDGNHLVAAGPPSLRGDRLRSLHEAPSGVLWIGTQARGLARVAPDGSTGWFGRNEGLPSDSVWCLATDRRGALWAGTAGGVARLVGDRFEVEPVPSATGSTAVYALAVDGEGDPWLALEAGVVRWAGTRFEDVAGEAPHEPWHARALHFAGDGTLWIGTRGGGLRRHPARRRPAVTSRHGLVDDTVLALHEDGAGILWLSTRAGVQRVLRRELEEVFAGRLDRLGTVRAFTRADGLPSDEPGSGQHPLIAAAPDGRLWFAQRDGVAVVDPRRLPANAVAPTTWARLARIDDREVSPEVATGIPADALLTFDLTSSALRKPDQVRFRHQLEGADAGWTESGARTLVRAAPPPGRYRLRVQSANEDGAWGPEAAPVPIEIEAPLLHRPATIGLAALGLAASVGLLVRARTRIHRSRAAALEVAVRDRTRELQEANDALEQRVRERTEALRDLLDRMHALLEAERGWLSREIHDHLGQLLTAAKMDLRGGQRALANADAAGAEHRLERAVSELDNAIRAVQRVAADLRPGSLDHLGLAEALRSELRRFSDRSGIASEGGSIEEVAGLSPTMVTALFRVFQECLTNVSRHARARRVSASLRSDGGQVEMEIEDDGVGISDEALEARQSLGLLGMSERVSALGGEFEIGRRPEGGTRVRIRLTARSVTPQQPLLAAK
jgi:signal transduction histidine kinase/ligand-binding sensor domain-containing protein